MGQIVGTYGANGVVHGFLLSGGTYTALNDPLGFDTTALGITSRCRLACTRGLDAVASLRSQEKSSQSVS